MPHSSGGGSHGGGSHGGSHGGSSSSLARSSYYSGCTHRYVYYKKNKPYYLYSNKTYEDLTKPTSLFSKIFTSIFMTPFVLVGFYMLYIAFAAPTQLTMNYNTEIHIEDNAGVINDENALRESLQEFQNLTGVTPAVTTVFNEDWEQNYTSLENYAYDLYVNEFTDEKHWLIVYSEPKDAEGFVDWHWEGMQGDDTDGIITVSKANEFTELLHKNILNEKIGIGEAISMSFRELSKTIMNREIQWPVIFFAVIWLGMSGFMLYASWWDVGKRQYKDIMEVPMATNRAEEQALEINCEYCGGIYLRNSMFSCPHCGAMERRS